MEEAVSQQQGPGVLDIAKRLVRSTLGLKAIMAVSGLLLVGFAFAHMAGHLQMFLGADAYNQYAHTLQSLGGIKWGVRAGLLGVTMAHVAASMALFQRNGAARPVQYANQRWLRATMGAKTMRISGPIVMFFILFHLLHFTVMAVAASGYDTLTWTMADGSLKGQIVPNVYERMVVAFGNPALTGLYVVGTGLLTLHLSHGIQSLFQTLGLTNNAWRPFLQKTGPALALGLWLGYAVVPLAVLFGIIRTSVG